ncbi:MAG: YkgJ family cysteine cluster protein [Lacrimispora sp.]|uniref:YkgJ family cysteine cluster protein n=1 Tax=Lacrimispora sp. TaxID=2719234 RepID=UPI0039E6454B
MEKGNGEEYKILKVFTVTRSKYYEMKGCQMKKSFHCIQCGECCRNIGHIPELQAYHNGDGICRHLNPATNLCKIYHTRPMICNVDKAYDMMFSAYMGEYEYLKKNHEGCKRLWKIANQKNNPKP